MILLDPVSEAIEKKLTTFAEDHQGKFCLNLEIIDGYTGMDMTLEFFREALHHIATLSYARGVEDSARVAWATGMKLHMKEDDVREACSQAAAAIRSLIPHKDTV